MVRLWSSGLQEYTQHCSLEYISMFDLIGLLVFICFRLCLPKKICNYLFKYEFILIHLIEKIDKLV
jgi:hypothetical protein